LYAGEQAMSKALVAARLYQAMANEAADDDLDVEIYDELKSYSKYFEDLCEFGIVLFLTPIGSEPTEC
jgi:hypothetical protein